MKSEITPETYRRIMEAYHQVLLKRERTGTLTSTQLIHLAEFRRELEAGSTKPPGREPSEGSGTT